MSDLSPPQLHALRVIAKDADAVRDKLSAPHKYRLDFGLQIRGSLTVGDVTPTIRSSKPDSEKLLAMLLDQFGPRKRRAVVDELIGSFRGAKPDRELAADLVRALTTSFPVKRRGNVVGKFDVAVIDSPES